MTSHAGHDGRSGPGKTPGRIGVLFVCLGNICRSPTAKWIFTHRARERGVLERFDVDSAGTGHWHVGGPADPRSVRVAAAKGLDTSHTARQFDGVNDPARFAYLIAMDRSNAANMIARGAPRERVRLMRSFDATLPAGERERAEVPDPYEGGPEGFEQVYRMLERACDGLIEEALGEGRVLPHRRDVGATSGAESPSHRRDAGATGFTLIELLLVIAIVAVLVGLLLPGLSGARWAARTVACQARMQQLAVGLGQYLEDSKGALPQAKADVGGGNLAVIGALFGGKKGTLPAYGINTWGAERRPLNKYVHDGAVPADSEAGTVELPVFQSPGDAGGVVPFVGRVASMYELVGSSYTLNDHALDGEAAWTLVPPGGGKMPLVVMPTRVWVLGTHTIYNHQEGGDRGMRWFGRKGAAANLVYADLHVGGLHEVPPGVVNTTERYTFLPRPDWAW